MYLNDFLINFIIFLFLWKKDNPKIPMLKSDLMFVPMR
jgi:hypothetical protein